MEQGAREEVIRRPSNYANGPHEPMVFTMQNGMEFWGGNVIKYVSRAGSKLYDGQDKVQSEITDLKKAMRYCEMRINLLEGKQPNDI